MRRRRTAALPARVTARASRGPSTRTGVAPLLEEVGDDAVELGALVEQDGVGGVEVLRPGVLVVVGQVGVAASDEAEDLVVVGDRQDDTVAEPVDQGPGAGPGGQAGLEELVVGDAAPAEVVDQGGPAGGCVPGGDVRVGAPAGQSLVEVGPGPGGVDPVAVEVHRHGVDRGQTLGSGDGVVPGGGALDHAFDLGVGGLEDPHGLPVQGGGGELGGDVSGVGASIDGREGRGRRELAPTVPGRAPRGAPPSTGGGHVLECPRGCSGRRGIEPGCLGVGLGSGQDGQAPHQGLTFVEVDGWVDRPGHVGDGVELVGRGRGRGRSWRPASATTGWPPAGPRGRARGAAVSWPAQLWCEVVLVVEVQWRRRGRGGG